MDNIVVLDGGTSPLRDFSMIIGDAIAKALRD